MKYIKNIYYWFKKKIYRHQVEQAFKHYEGNRNNIADAELDRKKVFLKFNKNNFKYLEWINYGGFHLPAFYFIKDGKKIFYLNYYEKMMPNGDKALIADRSLTTIN